MGGSLSARVNTMLQEQEIPFAINLAPNNYIVPGDIGFYKDGQFRPLRVTKPLAERKAKGAAGSELDKQSQQSVLHPTYGFAEKNFTNKPLLSVPDAPYFILWGDVEPGEVIANMEAREETREQKRTQEQTREGTTLGTMEVQSQQLFSFGVGQALFCYGFNGTVCELAHQDLQRLIRPVGELQELEAKFGNLVVIQGCVRFRPALMIVKTDSEHYLIDLHFEKRNKSDPGRLYAAHNVPLDYAVAKDAYFTPLLAITPLRDFILQLDKLSNSQ